jgi:hypothetical protein
MRFAFLIYVARSGSTLLARHLDAVSADLLVTPEWNVPITAMRLGEARLSALDAAALSRLLKLDRQIANLELQDAALDAIARTSAGRGARALVEALVEAHAARRGRAPKLVVIKNSAALFVADRLLEVFPEARFVHVYRDARGVVSSLIHTESSYDPGHPMGRGDPVHCTRLWLRYLDALEAFERRHPGRVLPVRYEAFLEAPEAAAAALAAELATQAGVELSAGGAGAGRFAVPARERGLHALVEGGAVAARAAGWQRELPRPVGIAIEAAARERLRQLGYAEHFLAGASPSEIAAARALTWTRHAATTAHHAARRAGRLARLAFSDRARAGTALRDALFERFGPRF